MKVVGVVGAGTIGVGVAQDLAQAGHRVSLIDVSDEILERAREGLRQNVRLTRMLSSGRAKETPEEVLGRVTFSRALSSLGEADFVIENVTENWSIKRPVYVELDAVCRPECVFAANTSCISITRIAGATGRPDRILGMHFMNPVPLKRMVEVIRGFHTSEPTIASARALLTSLGKTCIVVNDLPGFVSNRVAMLMVNEAAFLIQDGVAAARDVDVLFRECFGHKMGPLETADLIGLDTVLYSLQVLHESYADSKYRPCPLLTKLVDAGRLGRKSGKGFHEYGDPA